ncbi:MAG: sialate O-acetylesterase, partial [Verrucomicrobiaceae bacterium]
MIDGEPRDSSMGLDEMLGGQEAVATAAKDTKLRLLAMPKVGADTPQAKVEAKWREATPESLKKFSAVAATFAIHLHKDPALKDVPLGIIDTSFGGTAIEAWTPKGALPDIPQDQISQSMFNIPPGNLFNKMIAPLTALKVKGVAWYQGEANAGRPVVYTPLLKNLMVQWRKQWELPDLPFFVVQLPAFEGKWDGLDFGWLREAQERACRESSNAWSVVTYDTTKGDDLHPVEKEEIGRRIALLAAKEVYGLNVVAHGPVMKNVAVQGGKVAVTFDGPLKIYKGDKALGFSVAGEDGEYRFAEAKVDGDKVFLRADGIPKPKTVRFAWGGQPDANLVNAAGL